jgi:hypothetical protein
MIIINKAGCSPFSLAMCSIHSFLLLLFAYVGMVESNLEFQPDNLQCYAILGNAVWSLLTLFQVN